MPRFKTIGRKGNGAQGFDPIQMGKYQRTFDGKKFVSRGAYRPKSSAEKAAKYNRDRGYNVRVVKYKKGYVVFRSTSPKTKKGRKGRK